MLFWIAVIWLFSCDPSFAVTEQAITGRETPQARPRARKKYNQKKWKCQLETLMKEHFKIFWFLYFI